MALVSPRSIGTRSGVALAATVGAIAASGALSSGAHAQSAACWGRNLEGQCNPPTNLGSIQSIAGGLYHSIALRTNGSVVCWGSSGEGQTAVPAGLGPASAIASGHLHNLALLSNGTVVAWGRNLEGQSTVPAGLSGVTAVSAGWKHSVALKGDGSVVAWGSNTVGQLNVPATLGVATRIAAGGQHTLALRSNGTVVGWGAGTSSTGVNPHFGQSAPPAGLAGVTAIAGGTLHSAAVRTDGTVACWGLNSSGQCTVPAGLAGVASVVAGNAHTVALRTDGSIVGWGSGTSGQLAPPAGLAPASALFAGGQHSGGIVASAPSIAVVSTTPSTCSLANGAIDVTVTGAAATAWSGPNGFTSSSVDLGGLAAGSYTLTATGPGGSATTTVSVPGTADTAAPTITQFVPTVTRDADTSCNGAAFDFASTVVASDDCTAAGALSVTQTPVAGAILGLGTHAVTITVRDAAGNAATAQATFTVTGTPRPFCTDFDQDGFGDPATIAAFCQEPQGGIFGLLFHRLFERLDLLAVVTRFAVEFAEIFNHHTPLVAGQELHSLLHRSRRLGVLTSGQQGLREHQHQHAILGVIDQRVLPRVDRPLVVSPLKVLLTLVGEDSRTLAVFVVIGLRQRGLGRIGFGQHGTGRVRSRQLGPRFVGGHLRRIAGGQVGRRSSFHRRSNRLLRRNPCGPPAGDDRRDRRRFSHIVSWQFRGRGTQSSKFVTRRVGWDARLWRSGGRGHAGSILRCRGQWRGRSHWGGLSGGTNRLPGAQRGSGLPLGKPIDPRVDLQGRFQLDDLRFDKRGGALRRDRRIVPVGRVDAVVTVGVVVVDVAGGVQHLRRRGRPIVDSPVHQPRQTRPGEAEAQIAIAQRTVDRRDGEGTIPPPEEPGWRGVPTGGVPVPVVPPVASPANGVPAKPARPHIGAPGGIRISPAVTPAPVASPVTPPASVATPPAEGTAPRRAWPEVVGRTEAKEQ